MHYGEKCMIKKYSNIKNNPKHTYIGAIKLIILILKKSIAGSSTVFFSSSIVYELNILIINVRILIVIKY